MNIVPKGSSHVKRVSWVNAAVTLTKGNIDGICVAVWEERRKDTKLIEKIDQQIKGS